MEKIRLLGYHAGTSLNNSIDGFVGLTSKGITQLVK